MKVPESGVGLACGLGPGQPQLGGERSAGGVRLGNYNESLYLFPVPRLLALIFTVWQEGCTFGLSSFESYLNSLCSGFQIALGDICLSPVKPKGQQGRLPCTGQTGNCSFNFVLFLEGSRCPTSLSHKRTLLNVGVLADKMAQWAVCPSDVLAFCYSNRTSHGSITHQEFSAGPSSSTASKLGAQLETRRPLSSQEIHFTLEIQISTECSFHVNINHSPERPFLWNQIPWNWNLLASWWVCLWLWKIDRLRNCAYIDYKLDFLESGFNCLPFQNLPALLPICTEWSQMWEK